MPETLIKISKTPTKITSNFFEKKTSITPKTILLKNKINNKK